ncbi:MAG: RnfABCDGE type electron transport complex subunit D [Ruminococcaceae bacterium]|jgi:electron transport complex protein RnfD|nr:RnfABCDGE type electron transport complex subunit D [Oscillospiraceae bacterium]
MTDYKNLKLIASSSPHIRSDENTRSIMLDVIIAMLPALAMSVYNFGNWNFRALTLTLVSVVSCVFWEWLYRKLMKKPQMVGDLSAVVTGMLLAFVCPVTLPYWMIVMGAFFSIVLVKQLYGGIGCNFLNPALAGRALLLASFAGPMTRWAAPDATVPVFGSVADVVTAATPLAIMKEGGAEAFSQLTDTYSVADMFLGKIGGSVGEASALMLLLGGIYLLIRKVISWHTPVAYIATVAVICLISAPAGANSVDYMLYNLFAGGLMLGAIFMATDYATSPVTKPGQLVFGIGCGLITCFIRRFGSYPEGVCYSILIMNCTTWLLDKYIRPTIYGAPKKEKKEAAAK